MTKSTADILSDVIDEFWKSPKGKELKELLDNVNPSGRCLLCGSDCGKGHMLCLDCYAENKLSS